MTSTWLERTVQLPGGGTHSMLVDTALTDGTTEMYLKGDGIWVNAYLVALMFTLTKPGDRVLDLGGFVGEFALAAAAHGCEVVSVEANSGQAQMLATSAELNHFDDLRVVHAAVGERAGIVSFESRGPYGQVAHGDDMAGEAGFDRVMQLTVDDLIAALEWETVNFLKIDIEGAEADALRGASRLLGRPDAPALLIESNTFILRGLSPDPAELLRQVEAFGYRLYRVTPLGIWPWDATQFQPEVVCDYLALKGQLAEDTGLEVKEALTLDETADLISVEVDRGSHDHSVAVAWALQFAPTELLDHPKVTAAVAKLQRDSSDDVRSEAALVGRAPRESAPTVVPPVRIHEAFDGVWAAERALRRCAEARLAIGSELASRPTPSETGTDPVPTLPPGPRAMALARRISDVADRHPKLAGVARRLIR